METVLFTALAFGFGTGLALGLGLVTVLPRAVLFKDRLLIMVLAIDYRLLRFHHPRIYASSKYYRGVPDKSYYCGIRPFIHSPKDAAELPSVGLERATRHALS
ncbi:MAG: hypothetical protein JOZ29_09925 [Deltaproteobacteria bacterium]|nr:hypothetical protein [Deltaproteobacteria bacterium]